MKSLSLALALFLGLALSLVAQPVQDAPTYLTGFNSSLRLGRDLYGALDSKYRGQINPQPVFMETEVTPTLREVQYPDPVKPINGVFISVGFIDLVNNISHAKAIDRVVEKGFFQKYLANLSQESGAMSLKELPNLSDKRYWTDDVLNEQQSNFNQMVGVAVAIKMSHHYLGHFSKYQAKLTDANGKPVPINTLLTPGEWEESLKAGMQNALDCGLAGDGIKALFESIEKMPQRPAWTLFFMPRNANYSKMKKTVDKLEKKQLS